MRRTTQALVAVTGVAVVGIGLAHLILGGAAVIGGSPLNATAQGEHRFFAALFVCYGLAFLWCVPAIETKKRHDQRPGRNVPGWRPCPTRLDRRIGTAQRVLLRDAGHRAGVADAPVLPQLSTPAILLRANGFQPVTHCTAPTHPHHRATPPCRHTVVSSETNQRRTDEKWSDGMTFKRVACASTLAAGVGLAGLFGVGLGSASANPGRATRQASHRADRTTAGTTTVQVTTTGRATTTVATRAARLARSRHRPGTPGPSALQLERRTGQSRPRGQRCGLGILVLGNVDSAVTTPTMRRVTVPVARRRCGACSRFGAQSARYATASRMRSPAARKAATSGPARNTSRDTAGSTVPGAAPPRPRSASGRPPGRPRPGRAPDRPERSDPAPRTAWHPPPRPPNPFRPCDSRSATSSTID